MDDLISRRAVVNTVFSMLRKWDTEDPDDLKEMLLLAFQELPAAQPYVPDTNDGDIISRQAAIDALDVLCQEHRYKIPGKRETYSQYNEAWQDALDRAESAIGNLPSAQPKIGKWYHGEAYPHHLYCSVCFRTALPNDEYVERWNLHMNYCPNCGAKMEG